MITHNQLFTQARVKLTGWYLLIIMFISLAFSGFIYRTFSLELNRRFAAIEGRLWQRQLFFSTPRSLSQDLSEAKKGVLLILVYTNGLILLSASAAAYFLAGKTLAPIEKVLEEQKRFIADASHELKTPLAALQTATEVALRDKGMNINTARQVLSDNLKQITGLGRLSGYLLSLSLYQNSANLLNKSKFKIDEVLVSTTKRYGLVARRKNIKFSSLVEPATVNFNRETLDKLVSILLENALKFTPAKGKISLRVYRHKQCLLIKVQDSGVGINSRDLPHIFDRFYRADQSRTKTHDSGFGLGLAIAKQIVDQNQGKINVTSRVNRGTVFTIKLPCVLS